MGGSYTCIHVAYNDHRAQPEIDLGVDMGMILHPLMDGAGGDGFSQDGRPTQRTC
jgi:hypothetical protein